MRAIGIKALKDKLSEYVRLAANGETVLITDRDRVVAEIIPPSAGRALTTEDAALAEAVRTGVLTPPLLVSKEPPPRFPVIPLADLLSGLETDREDR